MCMRHHMVLRAIPHLILVTALRDRCHRCQILQRRHTRHLETKLPAQGHIARVWCIQNVTSGIQS